MNVTKKSINVYQLDLSYNNSYSVKHFNVNMKYLTMFIA